MSRIFLASRNPKKLGEMQRILAEHVPDVVVVGLDDVPAYDEPVEDEPTSRATRCSRRVRVRGDRAADRRRRQRPVRRRAQRDAGRALARAGRGRRRQRRAQQRAAARPALRRPRRAARRALHLRGRPVHPDGRELVVHGRMDGRIIREMRGSGGFGYDVLFVADEHADGASRPPSWTRSRRTGSRTGVGRCGSSLPRSPRG